MLSKSCQYAIRILMFICSKSKQVERVRLLEISHAIASPPAFTSKILQQLVAAKLICSQKGANGGFKIAEVDCSQITLGQIIETIEGKSLTANCFLGLSQCSDNNPCPVHHLYYPIKSELNSTLMNINLNEILSDPKLININLKT
ncbi:MAG: Rrf2 family transcriptional regulator [Bacteroidetes bacterium]|nr:MAG: Rrf2 family transcriptional regulator [Bacteroidota bacterium]MBL1145079.1 Rrf2 family transcriptional regulator [Bacteroidota bacterium]